MTGPILPAGRLCEVWFVGPGDTSDRLLALVRASNAASAFRAGGAASSAALVHFEWRWSEDLDTAVLLG